TPFATPSGNGEGVAVLASVPRAPRRAAATDILPGNGSLLAGGMANGDDPQPLFATEQSLRAGSRARTSRLRRRRCLQAARRKQHGCRLPLRRRRQGAIYLAVGRAPVRMYAAGDAGARRQCRIERLPAS